MLFKWMSRVVIMLTVLVLLFPKAIESDQISGKLCNEIKKGTRKILAMGESRDLPTDPHSFWVLVEGGYLFKLAIDNLKIAFTSKKASLTIDKDAIQVAAQFNLSSLDFSLEQYDQRHYVRYFLTTNQKKQGFFGRMTHYPNNDLAFRMYSLNGNPSNTTSGVAINEQIDFVATSWSEEGWAEAYGYQVASVLDGGSKVSWVCTFRTQDESTVVLSDGPFDRNHLTFTTKPINIITGFFTKKDGTELFVVLEDNSRVTIALVEYQGQEYKNKFETNLSALIECKFADILPDRPKDLTSPTPEGIEVTTKSDSSVILYGSAVVVSLLIGAAAYWWWRKRTRKEKDDSTSKTNKKKKNKGKKKKKDPIQSSGISSMPSSSPSSTKPKSRGIKSMFKGVAKVLGFNKLKAAKLVKKANKAKDKVKKKKKDKSGVSKDSMIGSKDHKSKARKPVDRNPEDLTPKDVEPQSSSTSPSSWDPYNIPKVYKDSMIGSKDVEPKDRQTSTQASSRDSTSPKVSNGSMIGSSKNHKSKNRKPVDNKPKDLIHGKDDKPESTSTLPSTRDYVTLMVSKDSRETSSMETEPKDRQPSTRPSSPNSTAPQIPKDSDGNDSTDDKSKARKPVDLKPKDTKSKVDEPVSTLSSLHYQTCILKDSEVSEDGQKPTDTEPKKDGPKDPKDSQ